MFAYAHHPHTQASKQASMATAVVSFRDMSERKMRQWAEENPGHVNDQDDSGHILLTAAAYRNVNINFITSLVDEKGADIDVPDRWGRTAIFFAKSADVVSFLLERGADPTLLDDEGWTALMWQSWTLKVESVERLLQDSRVVAHINVQGTGLFLRGCTALEATCHLRDVARGRARIFELLLLHGANPLLRNYYGRTALDFLRQNHADEHAAIALLEHAMVEPQQIVVGVVLVEAEEEEGGIRFCST